jgi:hypothetical protein
MDRSSSRQSIVDARHAEPELVTAEPEKSKPVEHALDQQDIGSTDKVQGRRVNRQLDVALLPLLSLLYLFNGLDRGNVGNAQTQGKQTVIPPYMTIDKNGHISHGAIIRDMAPLSCLTVTSCALLVMHVSSPPVHRLSYISSTVNMIAEKPSLHRLYQRHWCCCR